MTFGCKPENKPDGCGWARRGRYPHLGLEEWWCDLCERDGEVLAEPAGIVDESDTEIRSFRPERGAE